MENFRKFKFTGKVRFFIGSRAKKGKILDFKIFFLSFSGTFPKCSRKFQAKILLMNVFLAISDIP